MKYSLNWLKDHVSIGITPEALADRLTMAGLEVEAMHGINGDTVIEIEVTPNRADCLSVEGLAREVSAILNKRRIKPTAGKVGYPKNACTITIENKKDCRRYIGTIIKGVKPGTTPDAIKRHLITLGSRSISNIVDITNFCLIESGQPLHAFDYDKLIGGKIIVRRARKGEKITAIDDTVHDLDESILVIADEKRPVAIAGIMGGKDTEVTAATKNILLESAYFDPVLIRRGSRKLGLSSDSSYRFERGVDIEGVKRVSDRAAALILKFAAGKITHYKDLYPQKAAPAKALALSVDQINNYLGSDISSSRCAGILKKLDFKTNGTGKKIAVRAPSHRPDIKETVDVIEEIARIEGYDKLPHSLPVIKTTDIQSERRRILRERLKSVLNAQGFDEIITYSMTNEESLRRANQPHLQGPRITNPLSMDQEMMRPSLLPGMLNVVSFNVNRGQKGLRIFEAGKIYQQGQEHESLGFALCGSVDHDWRRSKPSMADFYDLKGAVMASLKELIGDKALDLAAADNEIFENGSAAEILLVDRSIGILGKVQGAILRNFTIKDAEVWFAQIDLENIYRHERAQRKYRPISVYPAIVRDISLTFDKKISYKEISKIVKIAGSKNLIEISFKEDYTNIIVDKIEPGHRGVLISLMYQSQERTLAEDEVNAEHQVILKRLVDTLKVKIR